jgi:hypothetical protein
LLSRQWARNLLRDLLGIVLLLLLLLRNSMLGLLRWRSLLHWETRLLLLGKALRRDALLLIWLLGVRLLLNLSLGLNFLTAGRCGTRRLSNTGASWHGVESSLSVPV